MPDPRPDADSPEVRARVVRMLLILSPFMFVFCLLFSRWQGAEWIHCLLIAVVGVGMCLAAAGAYAARGSKSLQDAAWLALILRILVRR
jgi:hypothetical protein